LNFIKQTNDNNLKNVTLVETMILNLTKNPNLNNINNLEDSLNNNKYIRNPTIGSNENFIKNDWNQSTKNQNNFDLDKSLKYSFEEVKSELICIDTGISIIKINKIFKKNYI